MKKKETRLNRSQRIVLAALVLSLLLHQLFLSGLGSVLSLPEEKEKETLHEITLQTEPVPEEPKKEVEEKKAEKPEKIKKPLPVIQPRMSKSTPAKPAQATSAPATSASLQPASEETSKMESAPGTFGSEAIATGPVQDSTVPPSVPKLNLTWKSFDKVFGDTAAADREAYTEASLERRRNRGAFGNFSGRVMRAVNNHQSFIKPGEQEALGARKAIFHNYIEAVHEASIHPKFADSFLASLPLLAASDPLNNMDLTMVAEFEIFESGQISEIRVIKTSGNMIFDAGAVDSIYRSSPFPAPPKEVLSWNRRVYIRWGFYRNNRKCGVFNVEPYILRAPGAKEEALPVDKFTVTGG